MSKYLSEKFAGFKAYVPGEQPQDRSYIKLNTNESPFPPSPGVLNALNLAEASRLNLYPDPDARAAGAAISANFGLKLENIILGNGSDELLAFSFQAFCDRANPPVFADITYGFYEVYARINFVAPKIIPLNPSFQLDAPDYFGAGGTVFVANPNSPTGCAVPLRDIEDILKNNPDNAVVVDEAYAAFGAESAVPLIPRYDNLVVIHTMSKSKNLAGARLGYALANAALIADLNTMKFSFNPYNVGRLSMAAAVAAMKDADFYAGCVSAVIRTREYTAAELARRGFFVLPSSANFIFAKPGFTDGREYYLGLKEKGVLVRHFAQERIKDFVRITIGGEDQMRALLAATDELMNERV